MATRAAVGADPDSDVGLLAEHKSRYRFAANTTAPQRLLDIACGSGLGFSYFPAVPLVPVIHTTPAGNRTSASRCRSPVKDQRENCGASLERAGRRKSTLLLAGTVVAALSAFRYLARRRNGRSQTRLWYRRMANSTPFFASLLGAARRGTLGRSHYLGDDACQ